MSTQNSIPAGQDLSATKRALLDARLMGRGRPQRIVRGSREEAPVSFAQERLWFLERLQQGGTVYNVPARLPLRGAIDEGALERAVGEIVRRHEALRTTFRETNGVPVQVIAPFAGFALPVEDLAGLDPAARDAELARQLADDAARPFDLVAGPPFRARLLRLGPDERVLLLCMHHIVSDGWSLGVLFAELTALYEAYRDGRAPPLPDLPVQYADYAAWQREQWRGETAARQLAYWTRQLAGAPEVLELPHDRPRPAVPSFRGGSVALRVSARTLDGLRELARAEGATLFMVLLAGFQVLLTKYSGCDDVVVGTPVAGRTERELEELIGMFVNVLVLRTDTSGDPRFRALLGRVREGVLAAYEHQEVPFERLVAELQPERSLSHSPLFQVSFSLDNTDRAGTGGAGLPAQQGGTQIGLTKFDLSLSMGVRGEDLVGALEYSTDLFDRGTIERMAEHLGRVLEQVAADPDRRLSRLQMMGGAEMARVVEEWARAGDVPVSDALHHRFEARAASRPGAVAVKCGGESLTYAALNARANRLARHLRGLGVGPESRVGLCAERSLDLVVGVLAILKAGAAYVPLDPAYPADRLAFMAEDSGMRVLLAADALRGLVQADGVEVVSLEDVPLDAPADDLDISVHASNLAYVIYTSGSTGRPKGVGVTHGNVLRLFDGTRERFAFGGRDVWTLFHSYAFDFSVWEMWGALLHGGRLVVVPFEVSRDPAAFHDLLRREEVTVLNQTPSAFRALARADEEAGVRLERLRTVVFGGEALHFESLRGWLERYGPARPELVNMYGITETTVHVTWHTVGPADLELEQTGSRVGTAIPDLRTYVLDPAGYPVPIGVPAELYVGGAGLARGYLGRPALTAARFVPDPFSGERGGRLYRSGDRARWRTDGTLEYLGRIDQQVKVRGFRIELGEIEAVLLAQPGVAGAAVVVRGEGDGATLVGYVSAAESGAPSPSALRAALRQHLPEYMVPPAVMVIERIPLTANGKLDRRALPAPRYAADVLAEAPKNYLEVQLIQIWEEELGVEGIGPTQSFFELGGNSLLALRLFSRVNEVLDCDLPVSTLFTGATVRAMAEAVDEQRRSAGSPPGSLVPLQPQGSLPPIFFIHSADRNVMGYVNIVRHLGKDQPAWGLRDLGDTARPVPQIAAEHVESIRAVQPHGPYYLVGWCFGGHVASEMALQLERAGETVAFLGLLDAMSPEVAQLWPEDRPARLAAALAADTAARMQRPFHMEWEPLDGLPFDEILRRVVAELHAQRAAPEGFDEEILATNCAAIRDRRTSLSGYVPAKRFDCIVTLYRATADRQAWEKFFASYTPEEQDTMGWCRHVTSPVQVFPVAGGHVTIGSEPQVRVLAAHMRQSLAEARARTGAGAADRPALAGQA